jgi:hypothetical protein
VYLEVLTHTQTFLPFRFFDRDSRFGSTGKFPFPLRKIDLYLGLESLDKYYLAWMMAHTSGKRCVVGVIRAARYRIAVNIVDFLVERMARCTDIRVLIG